MTLLRCCTGSWHSVLWQDADTTPAKLHAKALEVWKHILVDRDSSISGHDRDGALHALEKWFEKHFLPDYNTNPYKDVLIGSEHTVRLLRIMLLRTEANLLEMV